MDRRETDAVEGSLGMYESIVSSQVYDTVYPSFDLSGATSDDTLYRRRGCNYL
jgi:hypothetical protein